MTADILPGPWPEPQPPEEDEETRRARLEAVRAARERRQKAEYLRSLANNLSFGGNFNIDSVATSMVWATEQVGHFLPRETLRALRRGGEDLELRAPGAVERAQALLRAAAETIAAG